MRRLSSSSLALLSAVILTAQNPPPPAQDDVTFTAETNLVPLIVTVLDKSGKMVTNIPQSAFHVFENGVEQTIKLF